MGEGYEVGALLDAMIYLTTEPVKDKKKWWPLKGQERYI